MIKKIRSIGIIAGFVCLFSVIKAQPLQPKLTFEDDPKTHNMHIVSDGHYLYTVNGGKAAMGQISKFTPDGKLIATYKIELDMRSLIYNINDKKFYVSTYDRNLYCVTDLEKGSYQLLKSEFYEDPQATLALSTNGKTLYYFSKGTLVIYKFPSCKKVKTITGLDCGKYFTKGSAAVSADSKHIYTWNAEYKFIFVYDMKGKKIKSVEISKGDYGLSLSYANGLIFVANDGDYSVGSWYGYDLWQK